MTARTKRRLDLAGGVSKWLGIAVTAVALLKGYSDLKRDNHQVAESVATVIQDQVEGVDDLNALKNKVARLGRRVERLELKQGTKAGKRGAAAPQVDGVEVTAKAPGPLDVLTAPFRWLGRLLGG